MIFNSQGDADAIAGFINGQTITPGDEEIILPARSLLLGDVTIAAADTEAAYQDGYNAGFEEAKTLGGEGIYAWKKFDEEPLTVTNPSIYMTKGSNSTKITSDNVDLTKVTAEFFDGFRYNGTSSSFYFALENGQLVYYMSGTKYYPTYDAATTTFYGFSDSGNYSYDGTKKIIQGNVSFVVSNNANEYPDGENQNGFYYEKIN